MGQCLFKEKQSKSAHSRIYKKKEIHKEIDLISKDESRIEVIKHTKASNNDFKLLNNVNCETLSSKSSRSSSISEFEQINNNSGIIESVHKDYEQSIVLVNNDNLLNELLLFNQQNKLDQNGFDNLIDEYNTVGIQDNLVDSTKKTECKYEKVFRDGFNDDLKLLNKCANVRKPALYFYKEQSINSKNERQIILPLVTQQLQKVENKSTLNNDPIHLKTTKQGLNKTKIIQNDIGDCASKTLSNFDDLKLNSITSIGDKINSSKSIGLQFSKSKTIKRKKRSRNYLTTVLGAKHSENIYKYPTVDSNCFINNLNRNDSSNIPIDENDDELKNEKLIFEII